MTTEEKKDDCACGGLDAVYASIDALVDFARKRLELDPRDADWTRNRIFELFSLDSYRPTGATSDDTLPDDLLTRFRAAAVAAGLFDADEGPVYADIVMGMLSGTPSAVQDRFEAVEREHGGMEAMRWFYDYCVANNYVKKGVLDKNPRFDSHGLVITINLAKPEFKNMKKAAAGNSVAGGYPACTICHENEGFAGRNKRTLRTIPATLGDEPWFWQFSPYGYFYQHGICVNDEHTPMHVSRSTFGHLLDFVDRFPGYFLGCNAALPRIGGSVLAHDHYQGGGELLPMHKAAAWATMTLPEYPDATIEILDWPGTAVRVVAKSRDTIIEVCDKIREGWINYSNPELDIICEGEDGKRSAVSPSAIITERGYEMSLIFRNNSVSEAGRHLPCASRVLAGQAGAHRPDRGAGAVHPARPSHQPARPDRGRPRRGQAAAGRGRRVHARMGRTHRDTERRTRPRRHPRRGAGRTRQRMRAHPGQHGRVQAQGTHPGLHGRPRIPYSALE